MSTSFVRLVGNQSSRHGLEPRIIVLHTTEGANRPGVADLEGLAAYFDNPSSQASAHYGVDEEGNACQMVPDESKAWTQAQFNSVSLSIEQVGFSALTKAQWYRGYLPGLIRDSMILARWSNKYGIPLKHSTSHGVCQHKHLGVLGGGHHDCGDGYPERFVILLARLQLMRMHGTADSRRGRLLKARLHAAQRAQGVRHPRTTL